MGNTRNKQSDNQPRQLNHTKTKVLVWCVLLFSSLIVMACSLTQCSTTPKTIKEGKAFEPTRDTTVQGGEYHIPSMDIPDGVNVTFDEDVTLMIDGDVNITGDIQGICTGITMQVGGAFILDGNLNNTGCEEDDTADVTLNLSGDQPIQFGNEDQVITVDGDLIINVGDVQALETALPLPFEPAQESTPPVCSLTADTLVADLTEEGYAYVTLWAECLDPDDGPLKSLILKYTLMSTGETFSLPDNSVELHESGETLIWLEQPGVHFISLWAQDDEGDWSYPNTITVFVIDPELEEQDATGITIEQDWPFYEQGSEMQFESVIETTYPESDFEYTWNISINNAFLMETYEAAPVINLDQPGVMNIALTVNFMDEWLGYAEKTLYVTPEMTSESSGLVLAKPALVTNYSCSSPPKDAITFNDVEISLKNSGSLIARVLPTATRPIMILPPALIWAGDGKDGMSKADPVFARGENGGNGGRILIQNGNGDIVLCNGADFTAGSGGDGGDAEVKNKSQDGRSATALGGHGGKAGKITFIIHRDFQLVVTGKGTLATEVTMNLGKGGDGGDATAKAGDGKDDCNTPTRGGKATARAGRGGSMKFTQLFDKTRFVPAAPPDLAGKITINIPDPDPAKEGPTGGDGGDAEAEGGNGGNAANPPPAKCESCIAGKNGGDAKATSGKGGSAYLREIKPGLPITINFTPVGGKGGEVKATGGNGGNASDCPNANKGKPGGKGGSATAEAGKGGKDLTPAKKGTDGSTAGSKAGDGGTGGKGLMQGGEGGDPGKGWKGADDGEKGSKGGVFGDLVDVIKDVKVTLVNPVENIIKLTIKYTFPGWDWARGNPFVIAELEFLEELFKFDLDDLAYVDDETIEIDFIMTTGCWHIVLRDQDNKRTEAFEFEVEVPDVAATEEPRAQEPTPLPFEPVEESTQPVCSLSADSLTVDLIDGSANVKLYAACLDPDDGWPFTDWMEDLVLRNLLVSTEEAICESENAEELRTYGETTLALTEPGTHEIYLSVKDDEGMESFPNVFTLFVHDPDLENEGIGVAITQDQLHYELSSELQLTSEVSDEYWQGLIYFDWYYMSGELGEVISNEKNPVITLAQPGVTNICLDVTSENDEFLGFACTTFFVVPEDTPTSDTHDQGSPPVITAVEFPFDNIMDPIANDLIELPSDGTEFVGYIHFEDEDGDVSYASFEPMEADSGFQGFGFNVEEEFLEGDFFDGKFSFHLWCGENQTQQQITLRVMLEDAAGNWSDPAILALWCE